MLDFDDPERSFRRGYSHGAYDVISKIAPHLTKEVRDELDFWLNHHVTEWRLEAMREPIRQNCSFAGLQPPRDELIIPKRRHKRGRGLG